MLLVMRGQRGERCGIPGIFLFVLMTSNARRSLTIPRAASGGEFQVVFKTIAFFLWGREVAKKELGQKGLWTLSYLDDDMRILAARSLERDTGNLYILTRA